MTHVRRSARQVTNWKTHTQRRVRHRDLEGGVHHGGFPQSERRKGNFYLRHNSMRAERRSSTSQFIPTPQTHTSKNRRSESNTGKRRHGLREKWLNLILDFCKICEYFHIKTFFFRPINDRMNLRFILTGLSEFQLVSSCEEVLD